MGGLGGKSSSCGQKKLCHSHCEALFFFTRTPDWGQPNFDKQSSSLGYPNWDVANGLIHIMWNGRRFSWFKLHYGAWPLGDSQQLAQEEGIPPFRIRNKSPTGSWLHW